MGTFSINSISATVLFDSGASHTFISENFVRDHGIPLVAMKNNMIINSPGGTLQAFCRCPQVKLTLKRVDFTSHCAENLWN